MLRGPRGGRPAPEGARLLLGSAGAGASAALRVACVALPAMIDARPRPAEALLLEPTIKISSRQVHVLCICILSTLLHHCL